MAAKRRARLVFTGVRGRGILRTSCCRRSPKLAPSTVRWGPGILPETLAEIFRPFPGPIARRLYLRLLDALFAVGPVPELPEFSAGLGFKDGLHRFFDGLAAPVRPGLRLARKHFVGHLRDRLLRLQGFLLHLEIL
jgi:hypothetical protein